jgi:hypothetical protein
VTEQATDSLEFSFSELEGEVDPTRPLIYFWEIRDEAGGIVYRYVGKAKGGADRPRKAYRANVTNLLAGREYRPGKEAFRRVHEQMARAVRNGHAVTLRLLCNVPDGDDINKLERHWHDRLVVGLEAVETALSSGPPRVAASQRPSGGEAGSRAAEASSLLTATQRLHFRDEFKAGRATALADAEGYTGMLLALERLGKVLTGAAVKLSRMKESVEALAAASPLAARLPEQHPACHTPFHVLFDHVRVSRNAAMHEGAHARHLTAHLTQLALVLEDALMAQSRSVGDFVVRNPTCAAMWQPISFLRQVMLSQSYSFLPVALDVGAGWRIVTDKDVALLIQAAEDRQVALAMTLGEAVDRGLLPLHQPYCCRRDTDAAEALQNSRGLPILVVESDHLIGMATPFDLL